MKRFSQQSNSRGVTVQEEADTIIKRTATQDFGSSTSTNAAVLTRIYNEQLLREIPALTEAQKKKLDEINQIVAIQQKKTQMKSQQAAGEEGGEKGLNDSKSVSELSAVGGMTGSIAQVIQNKTALAATEKQKNRALTKRERTLLKSEQRRNRLIQERQSALESIQLGESMEQILHNQSSQRRRDSFSVDSRKLGKAGVHAALAKYELDEVKATHRQKSAGSEWRSQYMTHEDREKEAAREEQLLQQGQTKPTSQAKTVSVDQKQVKLDFVRQMVARAENGHEQLKEFEQKSFMEKIGFQQGAKKNEKMFKIGEQTLKNTFTNLNESVNKTCQLQQQFISTKSSMVTAGLLTHELNAKIEEAKKQLEISKRSYNQAKDEQQQESEKNRVRLGRKQLTLSFIKKIQAIDLADLQKNEELSLCFKEDTVSRAGQLFTDCIEEIEKYGQIKEKINLTNYLTKEYIETNDRLSKTRPIATRMMLYLQEQAMQPNADEMILATVKQLQDEFELTLYQAECLRRMAQVDLREAPVERRQIHQFAQCFEHANEETLAQINNHGRGDMFGSPDSMKAGSTNRKRTPSKDKRNSMASGGSRQNNNFTGGNSAINTSAGQQYELDLDSAIKIIQ